MDIFKFTPPIEGGFAQPLHLTNGQIINGLKTKMWVERYRNAGEFKFTANLDTEVRTLLPLGTIISHIDSEEPMIVENHEINDDKGKIPEITITGRSFETFFENRIVGSNVTYPTLSIPGPYYLSAQSDVGEQVLNLLTAHTYETAVFDSENAIPYISIFNDVSDSEPDAEDRMVKISDLYSAMLPILELGDAGIKVIRPGQWSPLGLASPNMAIVLHKGVDRSATLTFSYDTGELDSSDYFWTNRKKKTHAYIYGKWVHTFLDYDNGGYARRIMMVDATDIDQDLTESPVDPERQTIKELMWQRGREALAAQKDIALIKAEVSNNVTKAQYRKDYWIGDIVTVRGDYNETTQMRVTEYVEIEDERETSGHPTLSLVE